jgi:rhodanese-related sulfurtransferase
MSAEDDSHRAFKDRLYGQFARVGKALASPHRLADASIFELSKAIRTVAERRLAELDRIVRGHFGDRSDPEPVPMADLLARARSGKVIILDTRPANEFAAGHIVGALSVPVDELKRRLGRLPKSKEYVAYCRGPYCVYADRAVELLRASGRRARRLTEGFPEWRAAGFPVEVQAEKGAA